MPAGVGGSNIRVPEFRISGVTEPMPAYVKRIVIDYAQDGPDMFEITFLNQSTQDRQKQLFTHQSGRFAGKLKEGDEITIHLGFQPGGVEKMIVGEITSTEAQYHEHHPSTFTVRGFDKLHRLSRGRKQRTFLKMKDSDIAKKIAQEMGLQAEVDDSGIIREHVFQNNLSDIDFLYARARFIGFEVDVLDTKLLFKKPQVNNSSGLVFKWETDLKRCRFYLSTAQQVDEVQVRGWSPKEKKEIVGKASATDVLSKMSGSKAGGEVQAGKFGGGKRVSLICNVPLETQAEADAVAKARLNELSMNFITGEAEVEGNPKLKTGAVIELQEVGAKYEGKYYVVNATHTVRVGDGMGTGYTTRISFKRMGVKEV